MPAQQHKKHKDSIHSARKGLRFQRQERWWGARARLGRPIELREIVNGVDLQSRHSERRADGAAKSGYGEDGENGPRDGEESPHLRHWVDVAVPAGQHAAEHGSKS